MLLLLMLLPSIELETRPPAPEDKGRSPTALLPGVAGPVLDGRFIGCGAVCVSMGELFACKKGLH